MRILLVEDDVLIRETLTDMLQDDGLQVLAAASADEALGIAAEADFDLLMTDIRMPGRTNGWDLAEHCRVSHPELPVIYMTGYSDVTSRPVEGSIMLRKPFDIARVATMIRSLASAR